MREGRPGGFGRPLRVVRQGLTRREAEEGVEAGQMGPASGKGRYLSDSSA